jgi:hypothetical protein
MRLFGRKQTIEEDVERCPRCRERLPEGATECMMCGLALGPVRESAKGEEPRPRRVEALE